MPQYVFLLLLLFFFMLSLAWLWHLYWLRHGPPHSRAVRLKSAVQRLLKPRTPRDSPACRLSCTPSSAVRPAPAPVRPWREVKSRRGAPKRVNTEGFACPNQQCPYSGITDADIHAPSRGWHAWPCRAHPDVSLSGLPHDVHCPTPHPLVPSENSLPSGRRGVVCARGRAGPFRCRARLRLPASHHHDLAISRLSSMRRLCTSTLSATSSSLTCSWTNCAPGYAAPHRCCGSGWPSPPARSCFPSSNLVPARRTWHIRLSIPCGRSWPLTVCRSSPVTASTCTFMPSQPILASGLR